ncbi:MAG: hypothetical protein EAZ89_01475 [Bacteroidetes bacterium]|nr:MAG: hypothetical protein EAZ89_01475 [Bacteroidota bacterium]
MSLCLVFGKFMPLHTGHIALVDHALKQCDHVLLLVCAQPHEEIPGPLRLRWAEETFATNPSLTVAYTDVELPYTDHSSREISRIWGQWFRSQYPDLTHVCTSEPYGEYVAEYMGITHLPFDYERAQQPVSARLIRANPFAYWDYLPPAVRPHYVKKICLYGPESTGKSTLTEQLAARFNTVFVPEKARDIIADSTQCTREHLEQVVAAQTEALRQAIPRANKFLFCDTDLLTTQVYARYLFDRELIVSPEVEALHHYDLYLFCDTDLPYEQDGTRLGAHTREEMRALFWQALEARGVDFRVVRGVGEERVEAAVRLIS